MALPNTPHQIVIVGGGVAGLEIATQLGRRRRDAGAYQVTLVDRGTAHVWKPMLHMIAAGTRQTALQQTAYLAQARAANFRYEFGALAALDRRQRRVLVAENKTPDGQALTPQRWLSYDTLVLAVGSRANDFGTPGAQQHCSRIDSTPEAEAFFDRLRAHALHAIAHGRPLTVGIVGGGATGVELAAELVQLAQHAVAYGVRELRDCLKIVLIESGPRLLAAFPQDISEATRSRLVLLGVDVRTGVRVEGVDANGFALGDGSRIDAEMRVWAAGVKAQTLQAGWDGLETGRNGQLVVNAALQTTADPAIYAVGDCASCATGNASALPPTAQVAHQQAQHLIGHLPAVVQWDDAMPVFRYRHFGQLVALGDYEAFASLGRFGLLKGATLRGRLAQLSHALLYRSHQARLHGMWRGGLLWLLDRLHARLYGSFRMN